MSLSNTPKMVFSTDKGTQAPTQPIIQVQPLGYLVALAAVGYAPELNHE